ncbi:unnamed protein product [Symbiodinium sp. CCMP2592]|nr:unnamed protein product [Symbiodinium sp. CCMP2592]
MTLDMVPVPEPREGQVLVKVQMAAVNPVDWKLFGGGMHRIFPMSFPYVPGFDIAGTVVKVGEGVTRLAVGDEVCGDIGLRETCCHGTQAGPAGAFAEYAVAFADTIAKREGLSAEEVVGLPLVGLTSYQVLFTGAGRDAAGTELGQLVPGQKLLILGGGAATGSIAVQLARAVGAYVATTASPSLMPDGTSKMDYLQKLGADQVINYRKEDWAEALAGKDYDLIYDCVGLPEDWPKASKVLKEGGLFVSLANFAGKSTERHLFKTIAKKNNAEDLAKLVQLVKDGKLKVPMDAVFPFSDVPGALKKSLGGASAGKLVIRVSEEGSSEKGRL